MNLKPEPLTTELAKKKIKEMIKDSSYYLEYGSGGSTLYASNFCDQIISVETDFNFYRELKKMNIKNSNLIYVDIGKTENYGVPKQGEKLFFKNNFPENYCEKPWKNMKKKNPDLILIDGRFRVASTLYSILINENDNCNYMFDDYLNRPFYHAIEKFIDIYEVFENTIFFKKSKKINLIEIEKLIMNYNNDFR